MTGTLTEIRLDQPTPLQDVAPPPPPRRNWLLGLTVAFSVAVALVWIGAGVRSAGRGLNVADESFYLLSYRWWDSNHRNFTGVQYIYGPVFELLGYNIAGLRLFRLLTIVVVHGVLGWSFMRWLRVHRPTAPPTRLWEAAGIAAIVAAGGVACGWFPLSPGYNDAALLGSFLAMSFVLFAARHVDLGRPIPLRLPIGYGALVPLVLLTKWGSLVAILLTAVAAAVVLGRTSIRQVARLLGGVAAGMAIVVALLYLLAPVTTVVRELIEVNRLMASGGMSPMTLIGRYGEEIYRLLYGVVDRHSLLLFAAAVAVAASWLPAIRMPAGVLAVASLALSIRYVWISDGVHGGAGYTGAYTRTLLSALVLVLWIALLVVDSERVRRARWLAGHSRTDTPPVMSSLGTAGPRSWILLGVLVVLPMAHAVGTTGGLMPRAIGGFAAWMAVMIAVFTGIEGASALARAMVATVLTATVLASGFVAVGGLWRYPYRTYPYPSATETAAGVPALESIRLNRLTAEALAEMRRQLRPYVEPEGRAMIGVPAAVLALDGRPVGEPWPGVPARVEAGIRDECRDPDPWWASRPPLLLFPGPVDPGVIRAFRSCGIDFAADYRHLATYPIPVEPTRTINVIVFAPAAEIERVAPGNPVRPAPGRPRARAR